MHPDTYNGMFPELEELLATPNGKNVTFEDIDGILNSLLTGNAYMRTYSKDEAPPVEESEDLVNTLKDLIDSKSSKE